MEQTLKVTTTEESSCDKKDYRERYKKITQSDSFKSSYCNKSLGKEESGCESNFTAKSEDLEEEIGKYTTNHLLKKRNHSTGVYHLTQKDCDDIAHHFAEWQKQKDQEIIELAEDHAMLAGMNKMKEEMMKDAVEGAIYGNIRNQEEEPYEIYAESDNLPLNGKFKMGDKVKIIIVKED